MSVSTARHQVVSMMTFLKQRSERLESFHIGNSRLLVNDFCEFFTRDDVTSVLAQALFRRVPYSVKDWHDQSLKDNKVLPLPDGPAQAMAVRWATLRLLKREKIDLKFFVTNLFPGSYLNEKLMRWKRLVVHPFASDLRTAADGLIAALPDTEWVDLTDLVDTYLDGPFAETGFGPRAWTDDDDARLEQEHKQDSKDDPVEPPPAAEDDSLEEALDALKRAVEQAPLESSARADLLIDVDALRLEQQRTVFARPRFLARLDTMTAHRALRDACEAVRDCLPA